MNYYTIKKIGSGEYKNRGSKFFSYLHPLDSINEYKHLVSIYRKDFPEACHVCSAYRLFVGSRVDEYGSDDGEPRGTAGLPLLNQLKRNQLINVAVYVVRIFGGSLLGVPGLIESYSTSALFAIDSIKKEEYISKKSLLINISYDYGRILKSLIKEYNGDIVQQSFLNSIEMQVKINSDTVDLFIEEVSNLSSNKAEVKIL